EQDSTAIHAGAFLCGDVVPRELFVATEALSVHLIGSAFRFEPARFGTPPTPHSATIVIKRAMGEFRRCEAETKDLYRWPPLRSPYRRRRLSQCQATPGRRESRARRATSALTARSSLRMGARSSSAAIRTARRWCHSRPRPLRVGPIPRRTRP